MIKVGWKSLKNNHDGNECDFKLLLGLLRNGTEIRVANIFLFYKAIKLDKKITYAKKYMALYNLVEC